VGRAGWFGNSLSVSSLGTRSRPWIGIAFKEQFTGRVKEKWGKLTDDDLTAINGRRDQLEGKLQERYGWAKDQVRRDVDNWLDAM
jgi:uncharacterized protein YjbJ (UPF0337 family)